MLAPCCGWPSIKPSSPTRRPGDSTPTVRVLPSAISDLTTTSSAEDAHHEIAAAALSFHQEPRSGRNGVGMHAAHQRIGLVFGEGARLATACMSNSTARSWYMAVPYALDDDAASAPCTRANVHLCIHVCSTTISTRHLTFGYGWRVRPRQRARASPRKTECDLPSVQAGGLERRAPCG